MTEPPARPPDSRLNGWKDIANHLGKGVRTVQRWEKVYGLPVHRIGQDGGDIVFAFPSEIERWVVEFEARRRSGAIVDDDAPAREASPVPALVARTAPQEPAAVAQAPATNPTITGTPPRSRRPTTLFLVAAIVLAVVVVTGFVMSRPAGGRAPGGQTLAATPAASSQPAKWRVDDDTLFVFDADMRFLWKYPFDFDLDERLYVDATSTDFPFRNPVFFEDLDGDGQREVLFSGRTVTREGRALYGFSTDGTLRFTHHPSPTLTFGNDVYAPPWQMHGLSITKNADGTRSIWVAFVHGFLFPTLLEQLGADGTVLSSYISAGYVSGVSVGQWRGTPAVFVGGTNNETRGASLAIFAGTGVWGSSPAANPDYRCRGCDTREPDLFVVFPRSCLLARREHQAEVLQAWEDGAGRLMVHVLQGSEPQPSVGDPSGLTTYYAISPDLGRVNLEISREFVVTHGVVRARGEIDHEFGDRDTGQLIGVRRWSDGRYVPVAPGEVRR